MKTRIWTLCMIFGLFVSGAFGQDPTAAERRAAAMAKRKAGDHAAAKVGFRALMRDEAVEMQERARAGEMAIMTDILAGTTDKAITDQLEALDTELPENPRRDFTRLYVRARQDLKARRVVSAEEKLTEAYKLQDANGKRYLGGIQSLALAKKRQRKFAEASPLFAEHLLRAVNEDIPPVRIEKWLSRYLKCSAGRMENETVLAFLQALGAKVSALEGDEWLPVMQRIVNAQEVVR